MTTKISPFIMLTDYKYMDNFSIGYHSKQQKLDIREVHIGYPLVQDLDTVRRYKVDMQDATISRLLHFISATIIQEDIDGNNYGPHEVQDYCIEIINIERGVATVSIGS